MFLPTSPSSMDGNSSCLLNATSTEMLTVIGRGEVFVLYMCQFLVLVKIVVTSVVVIFGFAQHCIF